MCTHEETKEDLSKESNKEEDSHRDTDQNKLNVRTKTNTGEMEVRNGFDIVQDIDEEATVQQLSTIHSVAVKIGVNEKEGGEMMGTNPKVPPDLAWNVRGL